MYLVLKVLHVLGVVLFVRSPAGVVLTDAGARALELGRKLNEDIASFAREVQDLGDQVAGVVRVSASPSAIIGFLPERLHAFQQAHPRALTRADRFHFRVDRSVPRFRQHVRGRA